MKRLLLILPLYAIWTAAFGIGNGNYVEFGTNNLTSGKLTVVKSVASSEAIVSDRISCKRIRLGSGISSIVLENGSKIKVNTASIKSYRLNNQLFFQLPVYDKGKITGKKMFMQLVGIRGGYNLFKYSKVEEGTDKTTGIYHDVSEVYYYKVFRGDQFAYDVTENNFKEVFKTFGVNLIE